MGNRETVTVECTQVDDIDVLSLEGVLSDDTITEIREVIEGVIDRGTTRLALEMSGVNYISSAGIGMLVSVKRRSTREGFRLSLCGLNSDLQELFTLTRLDQVFTLADSVEAWQRSGS